MVISMKKILCMLLLIAITFSFTSCDTKEKNYVVAYDILAEPKNLDPQTASDLASLTVINNIFEGLFYIDEFGNVQNGLANKVIISADELTYTIEIKEDVLWTNGEKVTARDFVFGMRRLFRADTNSPAVSQFYSIKNGKEVNQGLINESELGVKALSDNKLQVELAYENKNLPYLLATTYAMPCNEKFFNETKGKYGLQTQKIMSNGPFDIYSWKHNESIQLKKSETYYDVANVKPAKVNLYISVKDSTQDRLLSESINAAIIEGDKIEKFKNKGHNTEAIENATWGLYFNMKNSSLAEENIRKAIATCFNRQLYSDILQDNLTIANAIIPHSIMMYDKTFREFAGETITQKFNAQSAYELYKLGLSNLNKNSISALKMLVNKDAKIDAVKYFSYPSQIIQKELALFINIDEVEEKEYNARIKKGDFDIALYELVSDDNSVNSILSSFVSGFNKNFISYSDIEYDTLIEEAVASTQKQIIINNYKNAEQKLIDDAVFIPMFYATDYFVSTSNTSGINYNKRTGLISFKNTIVK